MRKALSYLCHNPHDEFIRSDDMTGLNFSLNDIADALDDLWDEDEIPQVGRRFVASIVDLLDESSEKHYAVFPRDIGESPGGGLCLVGLKDFIPTYGTMIEITDREDNIVLEAEFVEGKRFVVTGKLYLEAAHAKSLAAYLRRVAEKIKELSW